MESEERLSICCTSHYDTRFYYDDLEHIGVCDYCKEKVVFYTEEESNE